jgi:hypothetical protein
MSNQKGKHKECARKSEVDKRIEEIRAELEEILERLGQNQRRIFDCWFQHSALLVVIAIVASKVVPMIM